MARGAGIVIGSETVLTARNLGIARDGRPLLRGIDLDLRRGEVVAILGPNGVGKSTLLAVLGGLLPAAGGTVTTSGRVAAALQAPAMARRSVQANVEAALGWWGVPKHERAARASAALERMRATDLAPRLATELSGGETRRVHLARALALEPDVLLLDEPFAGLDPGARADLLTDAGRVLRDATRATLVVLHDRAEAWALADRLIVLLPGGAGGGGIAAAGEPRALLEQPPSVAVAEFLGFTGRVDEPGGGVRCVRPAQVAIIAGGADDRPDAPKASVAEPGASGAAPLRGVVERVVPEEDGVLCDIAVDGGRLQVRAPHPGPTIGDAVRLRIDGGVRFPAAGA